MRGEDEPMPLSELPDYMRSVRESGQGDYVPVVDMGRIEQPGWTTGWSVLAGSFLLLACSFVGFAYATASTKRITIVAAQSVGENAIAEIVKDEGGRIVSVKKNDDGYEVRVFTLKGIGSFLEGLRRNKQIESADLAE